MDGLTYDRVTYLKQRRNANWGSRKSHAETNENSIAAHAATDEQVRPLDQLTMAVRRQVIPRLVGAHTVGSPATEHAARTGIDTSDVVEFTGLVASGAVAPARAKIERKRAQGMSLESVFMDLMIPAARRLSDLWESDFCHYEEIAVGMLNLQQLLHDLSPAFSREGGKQLRDRRALLLSAPCEQNMLGVFMVTEFYRCVASEFFHRDGWEVWPAPAMSLPRLLGIVSSQWFDLIEVSATCGARLSRLAADLAQIKTASRNVDIRMIVCGPAFDDHPEFVAQIGADSCAHNANETVQQADALLRRAVGRG